MAALVDDREPPWVQSLTFGGVAAEVTRLDAGDLIAACDDGEVLAIERKTPSDLLNTISADRLTPQLAKLREVSRWAYLLVSGVLAPGPGGKTYADGRATGWDWASVQGALLDAQELGVSVLHVADERDYADAIERLARRSRTAVRVQSARDVAFLTEGEVALSALPGIGPERAQILIRHLGTAAHALQWLSDYGAPLKKVPGVGPETKKRVRRALGLSDGSALVEAMSLATAETVAAAEKEIP